MIAEAALPRLTRLAPNEPPFWEDEPGPRMMIVTVQRRFHAGPFPPAAAPRPLRHSRVLHGELLCDEAGQLYERIGDTLRRLNRLVTGPRGEMLDVNPSATPWGAPAVDADVVCSDAGEEPRGHHPPAENPDVRILLPPGTRRLVRFGDVREIVAPQIVDPGRLRDAHRLSCFVQVIEAARTQPVEGLVPAPPSGEPCRAAIQRLTPPLASLFSLEPLTVLSKSAGSGDVARAGDRFLLIQVASDPTAAIAPQARTRGAETPATPDPPKTTIPAACLRPWEFVRSREEAEYDAAADASRGACARARAAIRRLFFERAAYRRWQALLVGRGADDQLWTVKPPARSLASPVVRAWAGMLLAASGYDVAMLREWEIFWRRKGV